VPVVEGAIVGARIDGHGLSSDPIVGLRLDDGERVVVHLGKPFARLVTDLAALTSAQFSSLTLRALHLVERSRAPAAQYRAFATLPASLVVVEPDRLINITDLHNAAYCVRQDLLRDLHPSPPSPASARGTLIHAIFKEMLKDPAARTDDLLQTYLAAQVMPLAESGATEHEVAEAAHLHLTNLDAWRHQQARDLWGEHPFRVRAETFLLAPEIGLKGRLDILLERNGESSLIELKTGQIAGGDLPRERHRWQVQGYHALLAARGREMRSATLLYSGTARGAEGYGIPPRTRDLHAVIAQRNALALARATGTVPPPPGGAKCERCFQRPACTTMSHLLGWRPPPSDLPVETDAADAAWFQHWSELQRAEALEGELDARALWRDPLEARIAAGRAIAGLELAEPPRETERREWQLHFRCENTSELREGDEVLISDGDPVRGAVVSGSILRIEAGEVVVWAREWLEHPTLIDRYSADVVERRTAMNLTRWLAADPRLRALVRGEQRPRFGTLEIPPAPDAFAGLNDRQAEAVMRALTMRDFLLIQGPPGTGKTKVIASIARALAGRGFRVALGAFTNQATDTMLERIVQGGVTNVVRLGHELATMESLRKFRLLAMTRARLGGAEPHADDVRATLRSVPMIAATAATWSSESYEPDRTMPLFDVAIVDEASQLTVPAILGILRWARKFVLVGDEQQLPPLVQHEPSRQAGLGESLFASLLAHAPAEAVVRLRKQYRMHEQIAAWPSQTFYGGELMPDASIARATLDIVPAAYHEALDPQRSLVWVDVPPRGDDPPKTSDAEAIVAVELARALAESGLDASEIGIIAPFRAQVARIRRLAGSLLAQGATIDTVDRFQGGERRAIILSLVATVPLVPNGRHPAFLSDPRRLNVALTRARQKLIILGWRPALAEMPLLRSLAEHCEQHAGGIVQIAPGRR
jgi:DNA replication ATP-dependent helicase Dna2